jgi:hypothetical protein
MANAVEIARGDRPPERSVILGAQILDGHLNGVIRNSDWYVLEFEHKRPGPRVAWNLQCATATLLASHTTRQLLRSSLEPFAVNSIVDWLEHPNTAPCFAY